MTLTEDELKDRCCWKRCRDVSDMIFYGVGLCNRHRGQACEVYVDTLTYTLEHVIPEAALVIYAQHKRNLEQAKESATQLDTPDLGSSMTTQAPSAPKT